MKLMMIDLSDPVSRESQISTTIDRLETFLSNRDLAKTYSAAELTLDLMEEVISDTTPVLDNVLMWWSRDKFINDNWDLSCQISKIGNYIKYTYVMWEYNKPDADPVDVYLTSRWSETLGEIN